METIVIRKGATYAFVTQWEQPSVRYAAITHVSSAAPVVITAPEHGLTDGWLFAVSCIKGGGSALNAKHAPPRNKDYFAAKVIDANTIEVNAVNGACWAAYISGGVVQFNAPVDLTGCTAVLQVRETDSTESAVLIELSSTAGEIEIDAAGSIKAIFSAESTSELSVSAAYFDMEITFPDGTVAQGAPGLSAYAIAKRNGFTGTEQEWALLVQGNSVAYIDMQGEDYTATAAESLNSVIVLLNSQGVDGSIKTFTLWDSPNNPSIYFIAVVTVGAKISSFGILYTVLAGDMFLAAYYHAYGTIAPLLSNFKKTTTDTVFLSDSSYLLTMGNIGKTLVFTSENPVTVLVQNSCNEHVFNCDIIRQGAGLVTLERESPDMTLQSASGLTIPQYGRVRVQGLGYDASTGGWQVNISAG